MISEISTGCDGELDGSYVDEVSEMLLLNQLEQAQKLIIALTESITDAITEDGMNSDYSKDSTRETEELEQK